MSNFIKNFKRFFIKGKAETKVHLILDIDGCVASYNAANLKRDDLIVVDTGGYGLWHVKPEIADWLLRLHSQNIGIRWASAWSDLSELLGVGLGLPSLPQFVFNDSEEENSFFKAPTVIQWISNLPSQDIVIWIDDEMDLKTIDWCNSNANVLAVTPEKYGFGLEEKDMLEVNSFINKAKVSR